MRRSLALALLTIAALAATAASASAATPRPVIRSFAPAQPQVGGVLVLNGKNFRRGGKNNRVYFRRASDGKTIRARARKATTRRIEVVIPAAVDNFLTVGTDGNKQPTRFQISVFSKVFGPYTKKSRSPLIAPAGQGQPGPGQPVVTPPPPPPPPDCDSDGTPDETDADDDNDGLADATEAQIGSDRCKKDTDGDGIEDEYEFYSALDLNSANLPYPGKRPYPNPLDGGDAGNDYDGDGMSQAEEFLLWSITGQSFGGRALPAGQGQSFPYSDGNQTSPAGGGPGVMDLDNNGRITDEEKDADNDKLPNWVELAKKEEKTYTGCSFTGPAQASNIFTDCGGPNPMPNGNTFRIPEQLVTGAAPPAFLSQTSFSDTDTDGDGVIDGDDDQDHDDASNIGEITSSFSDPEDPCSPNEDARTCPTHPSHT